MATKIKIGHASISENNSINGAAGDSTGREVYINSDFDITDLKPNVLLRPNTATLANASAEACEKGCENNNIGYSQSSRNTLYNLAKANGYNLSTVGPCNTDCSGFMTVCAIAGGSKIAYGSNAPTTTNMRTRFKQSGDYSVLTDSKHLTMTDYLKRGDILVCEGSHTVMVLENGGSVVDDDTSGASGITPVTDIRIRHIDINVSDIETVRAKAIIKITEQKSGLEDKILNDTILKKYKWSYILDCPSVAIAIKKQLKLSSGKLTLSLSGLRPGRLHTLQVIAKKDGMVQFCSQKVLFTTLPEKEPINNTKKEFTVKASNAIDRIYVKTEDKFSPAIIYK